MEKKICIVTGANAGIGRASVEGLLKLGYHVVMVCRNPEKGRAALAEIKEADSGQDLDLIIADLSSGEQVSQLADTILMNYPRVDVLLNNAGCFYSAYKETTDGIEYQFALNHLAYFRLSLLLMSHLKKAVAGRIVNVSSDSHYRGLINFENIGLKGEYSGIKAYEQSKLANVLFTRELAERLADSSLTVNTLHPGVVKTGIGNANTNSLYSMIWTGFSGLAGLSPEKGAKTSIYLASSDEVEGISGKYFVKCKTKEPSALAKDKDLAARLWQLSEEMTGIHWKELI